MAVLKVKIAAPDSSSPTNNDSGMSSSAALLRKSQFFKLNREDKIS